MEQLLDSSEISSDLRVILIKISQRLSKTTNLHPERLVLKSLDIQSPYPVEAGGYGNIYKASVGGHQVAAKIIRVRNMNKEEKIKVITCFRRSIAQRLIIITRVLFTRPYFGANYFIQMSSRFMAYLLWPILPEFALFHRGWKTAI
jgi:hypothetical protein